MKYYESFYRVLFISNMSFVDLLLCSSTLPTHYFHVLFFNLCTVKNTIDVILHSLLFCKKGISKLMTD